MIHRLDLRPEAKGVGMTSQRARDRMVERLREQGIRDERVLNVMRALPRHAFIDEALASRAYEDTALPIGKAQTISQPWVVARMTEALIEQGMPATVLEIGTGSGYQTAVLASLGIRVFTVERIEELLRTARPRFRTLNLHELIRSKHADGNLGWAENGPFDAILLTCAAPMLVQPLLAQLNDPGVLISPVGTEAGKQKLLRVAKREGRSLEQDLGPVSFVPLLPGVL
ncbi:protein-L-isoaspartate O-methyltransferase [Arenimonas maotaiensis]|uniref:Protein-L-isoaspartate O-methyltransferase n=1 Tax=Arenimonas maotaiensis TaxID=1446479 RepID=A0A917FHZ5_9GAMM|nr:protein-L-isoaspartate(D-aspartate) O-methyltransferase [Arenimonas maotaiensis]GGF84523.1 protein-L-isoaspartate O-methyltransferase [Arenimonas maotaiensis]